MLFQTQIFLGPSPGRPAGASTEERRAGGFLLIATSLAPRTIHRATRQELRGEALHGRKKEKRTRREARIGSGISRFYPKSRDGQLFNAVPLSLPSRLWWARRPHFIQWLAQAY